jgi:hypothetical protein
MLVGAGHACGSRPCLWEPALPAIVFQAAVVPKSGGTASQRMLPSVGGDHAGDQGIAFQVVFWYQSVY